MDSVSITVISCFSLVSIALIIKMIMPHYGSPKLPPFHKVMLDELILNAKAMTSDELIKYKQLVTTNYVNKRPFRVWITNSTEISHIGISLSSRNVYLCDLILVEYSDTHWLIYQSSIAPSGVIPKATIDDTLEMIKSESKTHYLEYHTDLIPIRCNIKD